MNEIIIDTFQVPRGEELKKFYRDQESGALEAQVREAAAAAAGAPEEGGAEGFPEEATAAPTEIGIPQMPTAPGEPAL